MSIETNKATALTNAPKKRALGEMQQRLLAYLKERAKQNQIPPTVREICTALSVASTSTIHRHLDQLEKSGYIRRDATKSRAITLMNKVVPMEDDGMQKVSRIGYIAAGMPIVAEENIVETLEVPRYLLGRGEHFALTVRGESMINAGIMDGDTVIVQRQNVASNRDIVVAMVHGEATVKRYFQENGNFKLVAENDHMSPIYTTELEIVGKVVSSFRTFK